MVDTQFAVIFFRVPKVFTISEEYAFVLGVIKVAWICVKISGIVPSLRYKTYVNMGGYATEVTLALQPCKRALVYAVFSTWLYKDSYYEK